MLFQIWLCWLMCLASLLFCQAEYWYLVPDPFEEPVRGRQISKWYQMVSILAYNVSLHNFLHTKVTDDFQNWKEKNLKYKKNIVYIFGIPGPFYHWPIASLFTFWISILSLIYKQNCSEYLKNIKSSLLLQFYIYSCVRKFRNL